MARLKKRLADVTREICQNLYDKGGVSAVTDYANKVGLDYGFCAPCENQMPFIECSDFKTCACCGGNVIPFDGTLKLKFEIFDADGNVVIKTKSLNKASDETYLQKLRCVAIDENGTRKEISNYLKK